MEKNYLVQLTNRLYRLTLLFPKKEPLRYKMREIADDILADFIQGQTSTKLPEVRPLENFQRSDLGKNLEVLDGFFEVARNQNWVSPAEISGIQEEYNRIKAEIKKLAIRLQEGQTLAKFTEVRPLQIPPEVRPLQVKKEMSGVQPRPIAQCPEIRPLDKPLQIINSRQERILAILKEKSRVQVWQIKEIFPEVSKRTLRRDFGFLLKQGKIERIGERNETFYQLKR